MRALFKGPSDDKFRELLIPNELDVLQQLVGGHIETVTIATDAVIICNEEGRILGLDPNCNYCGIDFVGPILIVGTDGEEFTDCPMSVTMANKGISTGVKNHE